MNRIAAAFASVARPMLIATGALIAAGAVLVAAGVDAGWLVDLAGILPLPVWPLAMVAIAVALLAIARSMAVEPRRTVAVVA